MHLNPEVQAVHQLRFAQKSCQNRTYHTFYKYEKLSFPKNLSFSLQSDLQCLLYGSECLLSLLQCLLFASSKVHLYANIGYEVHFFHSEADSLKTIPDTLSFHESLSAGLCNSHGLMHF